MTAPAAPPEVVPGTRTVLLLRHARSSANVAGVLAGRTEGVDLDDTGRAQADTLAARMAGVHVTSLVSSPLTRCLQTLAPLAAALALPVRIDDRLAEVDYGSWTGRALSELAKEDLWRTVQHRPSAAVFPDGESMAVMAERGVAAVRDLVAAGGGPVVVCSHGDVLKAILADALGLHLDGFQRINVAPASLSVVRYSALRPIVERINDTADLTALLPPPDPTDTVPSGDAVVGGATA